MLLGNTEIAGEITKNQEKHTEGSQNAHGDEYQYLEVTRISIGGSHFDT
jgi:hypothetical protein